MRVRIGNDEPSGCGVWIFLLLLNVFIGGWAVSTILAWFGKDIPLFVDLLLGFVAGEIAVPVAIVGYILKLFGVF